MSEPSLLSICVIAFVAVMLLLGFEALIIRLMSQLFPERKSELQLATEAIQQAVEGRYPGARVVAVEAVKPDQVT
jgi:hypothetical protein